MRVTSWKMLALSVGWSGCFLYQLFHLTDFGDVLVLFGLGYVILRLLLLSFSGKEYETQMARAAREKQAYRKLFGSFAPVAPLLPLLVLFLSWGVAALLPWELRVGACLLGLLAMVVSAFWLFGLINRHVALAEALEKGESPSE